MIFLSTTVIFGVAYLKSPHCDEGKIFRSYDRTTWEDSTPNWFLLPTKKDIAKIEEGMDFDEVVEILGKPNWWYRYYDPEWYVLKWNVFGGGTFYLRLDPKSENSHQYVVSFLPEDYKI